MKQFNAAHLEVKKRFSNESFATHPYECGWADEAIFFIMVEVINGKMDARVQLSLDGVHWVDEGTKFQTLSSEGLYFVKVREFGGYLRLVGEVSGDVKVGIQIACKG